MSSNKFILYFALFITALNYKFFAFGFENLNFSENISTLLTLPILFYSLIVFVFGLIFLPYITKALAIFVTIVGVVGAYFMNAYSVIIDSEMIRNALQTDAKEVQDLLNLNMIFWIFLAIVAVFLIIKVKITKTNISTALKNRTILIISSLVVFGSLFGILSKDYIPFFRNYNQIRFYTTPFYSLYSSFKYIKSLSPKAEFNPIGLDAKQTKETKKLFVFVAGETARAANYSLNGYDKYDTNPYSIKNGLLSFSKFSSCGTSTAISLPCMFSNLNRDNFSADIAQNSGNLLDVLETAGIKVSWIGNNSGYCKGVCARLKDTKNFGGDSYDGVMLDEIRQRIQNTKESSFIVIHLQGSHGPTYFKRYPKEFAKFSPTCDTATLKNCTYEEIVNTYDNTILYTDYIVNQIVDMLEQSDMQTGLFYVSDHGESLGENGIYLHGAPYFLAPDFQTKVPALLWLKDQNQLESLKILKDNSFSHDNIFHTMLGFFAIQTSVYNPNLDIMYQKD
ncbi:phosphoethanolamine transferase [Campylobacter sp. P0109]|uniref:phosphoethanolamine transferase n=1 Tax=Campylobacter sp. P0109 TaxID=1895606 RepID=UPI0015D6AE9B|nr:phosphoethanolamine--lipid A transferase [Campylobacter sp. P0109]